MRKWTSTAILSIALAASSCSISPQRSLDRGNGLFNAGRYAEADLNYQKAIQADPNFGEAHYRLGLSKFREGQLTQSYQALTRAVDLLPTRDEVIVALADTSFAAYLNDRRNTTLYSQVVTISGRLLQKNPNSYDGLRLKGYVSMLDRHFPEAYEILKKADAIKPMQADVIDAMMQCLIATDRFPEAEKLGLGLLQRQPNRGMVYDTLYNYYAVNKRFADGEALLRKKVDSNPDVLSYRLQLAGHFASVNNDADMSKVVRAVMDNPAHFPGAFLEVGNFYFSLRRYDDALRTFQAGAKQQDREQKQSCQKQVVEVLMAQAKWDQALAVVQEMLKSDPQSFDARSLRAEIALDSGVSDKTISTLQELRDLVKISPNSAVLHYNLGRAYVANSDSDSALAEFNQAMKLDIRYLQPRLMAANLSMERRDYQRAGQYADEILGLTGDNASARLLKAASLTGLGNFNEAARELNQLNREYPQSPLLKIQSGELLRAEKNYKEAENIFRAVYEGDRTNMVALNNLVNTYYDQGKYDTAIQYLTQEQRRNNSTEIRGMLAEAALRGKKLDLAVQQYSDMAAAEPQSAMANLKLGDAYLQKGDVAAAVRQFELARKLAPKDALVNAMLALAFHNSGRSDDAQKAYRDTLALQSNNPQVKNNLAYLLAETGGNLDEALRLAQEASRSVPADMAFSDTVGWIYFKRKNTDSAIQVLTNVVQKEPKQAVYHYHLGAALLEKGDRAEARKQLQEAMNDKPSKVYEDRIRDLLAKVSN
jgi:tetratricopeptide (TPR) repeat protein